ncbi:MAG: hypothetical protein K8L99_34705 [Anaerolineae bacterium]|nr:hypothetical protein [Anaerolineae bacterium]
MNILGVGGWELLAILLIMLLFAGPKRMVHWAYIMGQYVAKFRAMWAETVDVIQKEFDDAGLDVKIPKEPPTRANVNRYASKALDDITRPVKETMDEAVGEVNQIKSATAVTASTANKVVGGNGRVQKPKPPRPSAASTTLRPQSSDDSPKPSFGTWSGQEKGKDGNFGTWSNGSEQKNEGEE